MIEIEKKRSMIFREVVPSQELSEEERQVRWALWRAGDLSWKLKGKQIDIYNACINQEDDVTVILCSRRFGKSLSVLVTETEICIQNDHAITKHACPTQKMVKEMMYPNLKVIFHDAPPEFDLDKIWYETEGKVKFPNGSVMTIAGTDGNNADNLRGAYCHFAAADEAGFMDNLDYVIRSILLPQTDTTGGKLVMLSTPNFENPQHEFHTLYVDRYEKAGKLIKFTLFDSPMVNDVEREKIIARYLPEGINHPKFRCEYLVEVPKTSENNIIPEFYPNKKDIVIDYNNPEHEKYKQLPQYFDFYVGGDIGTTDLTVFLFGYYNNIDAELVILDEWVMNGNSLTTKAIIHGVKEKESVWFRHPDTNQIIEPLVRVMDNDKKLVNDFIANGVPMRAAVKGKGSKLRGVMKIRQFINEGRLKIHPRCKHLIYHLESGQWKQNADGVKEFAHLDDSIDGDIKGGHCDACFVPGTRVLTRNGYQNIEDIVPGTEVLTHKGRFKKVKHNMSKFYSGDLFELKVKGKYKKILGTVDHRYFVTDFEKTRDSDKGFTGQLQPTRSYFSALSENMRNKRLFEPFIPNNNSIDISNEMCFLYGYWAAEGSLSGNGVTIDFAGHMKETNVSEILLKAVQKEFPSPRGTSRRSIRRHKLGEVKPKEFTVNKYQEGNSRKLTIACKPLWKFLKTLGKSDYKKFPYICYNLNREQTLYMLSGYLFGDGCFTDKKIRWSTISPYMSDAIEIMLKKLGYKPNIQYRVVKNRPSNIGKNNKDQYQGCLSKDQSYSLLKEILSHSDLSYIYEQKDIRLKENVLIRHYSNEYVKVDKVTKIPYNGRVYNLEVEDDESYCVEGIAVHNCDAVSYLIRSINEGNLPESKKNRFTEDQHNPVRFRDNLTERDKLVLQITGRRKRRI